MDSRARAHSRLEQGTWQKREEKREGWIHTSMILQLLASWEHFSPPVCDKNPLVITFPHQVNTIQDEVIMSMEWSSALHNCEFTLVARNGQQSSYSVPDSCWDWMKWWFIKLCIPVFSWTLELWGLLPWNKEKHSTQDGDWLSCFKVRGPHIIGLKVNEHKYWSSSGG